MPSAHLRPCAAHPLITDRRGATGPRGSASTTIGKRSRRLSGLIGLQRWSRITFCEPSNQALKLPLARLVFPKESFPHFFTSRYLRPAHYEIGDSIRLSYKLWKGTFS